MNRNENGKVIENHEYDGIQELDNPLPGWWLGTFYGTVIFAFLYVAYFHIGSGPSLRDELAQDIATVEAGRSARKQGGNSGPSEQNLLAVLQDPSQVNLGKSQFAEKCASCHGVKGEGTIGPNLTDTFWIHGNGSLVAIAKTVGEGVPEKGMPPWKALMKENELFAVVAYVKTLKGTNPENAKAPQGVEVKE